MRKPMMIVTYEPRYDSHALAMALQLADLLDGTVGDFDIDNIVPLSVWLRSEVQRTLWEAP